MTGCSLMRWVVLMSWVYLKRLRGLMSTKTTSVSVEKGRIVPPNPRYICRGEKNITATNIQV